MKIVITDLAEEDIDIIYDYISFTFGQDAAHNFLEKINFALSLISDNPEIGRIQKRDKNKRGFIVANRTQVLYRIDTDNKRLVVLSFFDVRQHPARRH